MTASTPAIDDRRQWILAQLQDDEAVLFYEPPVLDFAILGLSCPNPGRGTRCVVYDYAKVVEVFVSEGMTQEDAVEWVEYNTLGAWLGGATPICVDLVPAVH